MGAKIVMAGNGCGHDVSRPRLQPLIPIPKGPGGLPRILSLAAERAKDWYYFPEKCTTLYFGDRQTRSERREAHQRIIEAMLSFLDLPTLCLGRPSLDGSDRGFVDVSMKDLVYASGMKQRRIERSIDDLKEAGLVHVPKQRREINDQGAYYGLRAIRVIKKAFFELLNLGPMLKREQDRATASVKRRAAKIGKSLGDAFHRRIKKFMPKFDHLKPVQPEPAKIRTSAGYKTQESVNSFWNTLVDELLRKGYSPNEALRRTNELLGLAEDYRPGH